MLPFLSHHHLKGITKDQMWVSQFLQMYSTKCIFVNVTESGREFDRYPQVKRLILAEQVLVMVNPMQQGHSVKTEHSSAAQLIHLSPGGSHGWIAPITVHLSRIMVGLIKFCPADLWISARWWYKDKNKKHRMWINEKMID